MKITPINFFVMHRCKSGENETDDKILCSSVGVKSFSAYGAACQAKRSAYHGTDCEAGKRGYYDVYENGQKIARYAAAWLL